MQQAQLGSGRFAPALAFRQSGAQTRAALAFARELSSFASMVWL